MKIQQSQSDVTHLPRHNLWLAGCTNKEGEIPSEQARQVAEYCVSGGLFINT